MERKIALYNTYSYKYAEKSTLFRPDTRYPEYQLGDILEGKQNHAYSAVRECFILLGLDKNNIGTKIWNPLGEYIKPGNSVLIKPNLVKDTNDNKKEGVECLYTQPAVVAAVIDYALIALQGKGEIIVGDAPVQECDFERLMHESGFDVLEQYYQNKGFPVKIVDFRELSSKVVNGIHHQVIKESACGSVVQLGKDSAFYSMPKTLSKRLRITNYDPRVLSSHHNKEKHEYYISDYVLNADVIINMPKPKTHRKAGVTISLKNFVGANIRKEYLPHHTMGSVAENGDEYKKTSFIHGARSKMIDTINVLSADKKYAAAKLVRLLTKPLSMVLRFDRNNFSEGSWYGNQTISKTISDLNKIIYYADKNGVMNAEKQRKIIIIADMIVSGEGEGPLMPSSKNVGMIAMGDAPLQFDETIARLMGFDPTKIPTFIEVRKNIERYCFFGSDDEVRILSNDNRYNGKAPSEINACDRWNYNPTSGWKGHIEIDN